MTAAACPCHSVSSPPPVIRTPACKQDGRQQEPRKLTIQDPGRPGVEMLTVLPDGALVAMYTQGTSQLRVWG